MSDKKKHMVDPADELLSLLDNDIESASLSDIQSDLRTLGIDSRSAVDQILRCHSNTKLPNVAAEILLRKTDDEFYPDSIENLERGQVYQRLREFGLVADGLLHKAKTLVSRDKVENRGDQGKKPNDSAESVGVRFEFRSLVRVNDFVVKFANVNGSGSASANRLFAKSIMRMGVPVSCRNIFPSNIQGLPTWYEVRISKDGYLGRRGGVDFMVAMNPQTWDKDMAGIEPGGYVLYDNSKPLPPSKFRDDVTVLGIPFTELCTKRYQETRLRQLFKNIIYVGALSALLDIDVAEIEKLIGEQFKGKDKLIRPNVEALHVGRDYALEHFVCPLGLRVERADEVGDRIFIDGNNAAALGAIYGGATVAAWYPITPSSSLAETFERHASRLRVDLETGKKRYAVIQAEDELASIGMVIGAAWNGARAFTATSGPGVSLMQEFLGLAYFAEVPAVLFDIQRGGPSTGMPTRTQQSDLLISAYASHGDTKHVVLLPEDPRECFDFAAEAFDLADRLQTPILVLSDLDIGMNEWLCRPLTWDDSRRMDRGKVLTAEDLDNGEIFGRYLDIDGDGITYRTYPGTHPTKGAYFTRGTSRDRYARYSEEGSIYVDNMERLEKKFETAKALLPEPVLRRAQGSTRCGIIYYGSTSPAVDEAMAHLHEDGIEADTLRIRAFPFHEMIKAFVAQHEKVFLIEQNRDAQMKTLLVAEEGIEPAKLVSILHYDGTPITARFIVDAINGQLARRKVVPIWEAVS